jgi:hypothetical protein
VIDCVPLSLEFLDNMLHTQLLSYCVIGYNLLKQPVPVSLMGAAIRIHFVSILIFQGIFSFVWWNVPMLQALIPVLHLLLPRAYFSASNGSGDELSSYLKVKTVVAIGKKFVQLEWVPIGGTRFFHLPPVPQVIYTFPLFVYQVITSCKLQSFFNILLILPLQSYNEVLHCFVTIGIVYPEDTFTYLLHVMEPFFLSPAWMHYLHKP